MNKSILLIHPKSGFEAPHGNVFMPTGLMSIAAPLVEKGYKVKILDQRIENRFFEKLRSCLSEDPICAGITTMTGTQILHALESAKFIRNSCKIPIVWGGVHPTLTAAQTIKNENVDIVVRGEGDITFDELVQALESGSSYENIKGITWKNNGQVFHNQDREFCDLDKLAPMPYDLVDVVKYLVPQIPDRKRCLHIYASRGCPRECIFCYNTRFNKSKYRKKNIDKVISEIEYLVDRYNLDSICIDDDNFSIDIERTHYFCRELIKKKIVPAWAAKGMEISQIEKMDIDLLEASGCRYIYMGIESGSEKILKFLKRKDTLEGIKRTVQRFSRSKIIAHYDLMLGFLTEDSQELDKNVNMVNYIRKTDPKAHCSSFHIAIPFPGTELFRIAVEKYGFVPPEKLEDWYDFRWESVKVPWLSPRMRKIYTNVCLITFFTDEKFTKRTKNPALKIASKILSIFAKMRWKNKEFEFCPEFSLVKWMISIKIKRIVRYAQKLGLIVK